MQTIFIISNTTESCLSERTNQKKEKAISDFLVIARPARVTFGLSMTFSSPESQINASMTSLVTSPPELMVSLSYSSFSLSYVSLLSALALLSFVSMSWHFSVLVGQL